MKYAIILALIVLVSCKHPDHKHPHEASSGDASNDALVEKVMATHDEVMPKMQNLYNLKTKLQDSIAHTPKMEPAVKMKLEGMIASLDSANASMMDWMHQFNPNQDSTNAEKTREYLENQIEKINKIKEATNEVIEKAETVVKK